MALATIIGILLLNIPNKSHNKVPVEKSRYIKKEILCVSFVRMVLIAWGKKDPVVSAAAANPSRVISDIR